jgi:hypothetical protein
MSLLHHPNDTRPDDTVTDVMASNAVVTKGPQADQRGRAGDRDQRADVDIPGASVGLIIATFLALVLSAWAAIVPFVGPAFGFSADRTASWTWNHVHALGALLPGAVGVLACLLIIATARRPLGHQSTFVYATWGFVVFLCGAWLTATPVVWPVLEGAYFHAASPSMTLAYWMGYSSGPGILLVAFGAFVMGRAGRQIVSQPMSATHETRTIAHVDHDPSTTMAEMRSKHVMVH